MKHCVIMLLILALPIISSGDTFVTDISVSPENPAPMEQFRIHFTVSYPFNCWELGNVEAWDFYMTDTGAECTGGMFLAAFYIDRPDGLPEGRHQITITEHHDGVNDPGTWDHIVEVIVGTPPVAADEPTWSALKSLYR